MTQNNLQINSAAITDRGLSQKRPQNEDSYLELRDSRVYAVADGVGGAQAGDVASQMAMEILGEAFINLREGGDAEERMKLAIEQANIAIYQMSRDLAQLSTMATTVVGLHVSDNNIATIGHVGDSRLYRVDSQGVLYRETQDHSVVEEEMRAGRLTPEEAAVHPSRNVISRALGAEDVVEIDMKTIMFESGTTFLICSDGVNRHISDDELQQLLTSEDDLFVVCQKIKDICYQRGAQDNLTAVVVKAEEATPDELLEATDLEEETLASARTPLANSSVFDDYAFDEQTSDTLETLEPDEPSATVETDEFEEGASISIAANDQMGGDEVKPTSASADATTYRVDEESTGAAGKFLTYLPWLLLVVILLFIAYYWWSGRQLVSEVNQLPSQSANVSTTAFDKNRRTVDDNPAQAITQYSTNPKDAEDFFLLGRAHFLRREYEKAKNNLEQSKNLIPKQVSVANQKVIETEIPVMLAIISSEDARIAFEKGISGEVLPQNSNSVTNSASNSNNSL